MRVHRLKHSAALVVWFVVILSACAYPAEAAQTTIHQIISPKSVIAGSQNPIPVAVMVYYNNTVPGDGLVVGILDAALRPQRIVPGVVISSTDPCINQPELAALCTITIRAASGAERITFQIGGIFGGRRAPGTWVLNFTSALIDVQGHLVPGSVSSTIFMITLVPVALTISVPAQVAVSVDGVQQTPGPVSIGVGLGQHNITVPELVQVNETTRLRFTQWSDGYPTTLRSIVVINATTLQAVYVRQNLLTLIGAGQNATGTGWYDANTNATFSTNQYQPMRGVLASFGAKLVFHGWFENGQLLTSSSTGTIGMGSPHTLTAIWQVDYSIPEAILFAAVAAVIVILLALRRRKLTRPRRRRQRTRRKHS
jgi:hypothetical protein